MKLGYDMTGLKFDAAIEELERRMQAGVEKAGLRVERTAKRLVPKDTHALEHSIQFEMDAKTKAGVSSGHVGVGGGNANYAIWVHEGTGIHSRTGMGRKDVPWGYIDEEATAKADGDEIVVIWTSGNEPQPFLEDAYKEENGNVQKIIAREIRRTGG